MYSVNNAPFSVNILMRIVFNSLYFRNHTFFHSVADFMLFVNISFTLIMKLERLWMCSRARKKYEPFGTNVFFSSASLSMDSVCGGLCTITIGRAITFPSALLLLVLIFIHQYRRKFGIQFMAI